MKKAKRFIQYTGTQGMGIIQVDTSDDACKPTGFKLNQEVITPLEEKRIFVGVGVHPNGFTCAWLLNAGTNEVTHWHARINLKEEGFKTA